MWDFDASALKKNSVLLLLPHSSGLSDIEKRKFEQLIEKHINKGQEVYIKKHPTDKTLLVDTQGANILEGAISVERYLLDAKFSTLYSGLSTVMLTAHWLGLSNIVCYSEKDTSFLNFLNIKKV